MRAPLLRSWEFWSLLVSNGFYSENTPVVWLSTLEPFLLSSFCGAGSGIGIIFSGAKCILKLRPTRANNTWRLALAVCCLLSRPLGQSTFIWYFIRQIATSDSKTPSSPFFSQFLYCCLVSSRFSFSCLLQDPTYRHEHPNLVCGKHS